MIEQDIAPLQEQSQTQYYDDNSGKYQLNADEEVLIQDLVAEIRDQFSTDIQNSIAVLRGSFSTRPLFVMFETSLECNPLTDHLIPKNVYPLFETFIQSFERSILSIFDQKIQSQIVAKLLEVFCTEMEQKQQLENYNFQLYEQLYKLQKQTDVDETNQQNIVKKFQQEKIKFLKDQLNMREQSFQAVRFQQKNYNPDQPDYEAELLQLSDLYSSAQSSKQKDLIIRRLQQEKRFLKYEYQSMKYDFDLLKQENDKIPELKRLLDLKISEINKQKEQFREERMKLIDRLQEAENSKDEVQQLVDQKEQGYMSLQLQNQDLINEIDQLQTENRTAELKAQCDHLNKFSIQQTRDLDILKIQLHEYQKKDEANEIKYKNAIETYQTERNSQLEAYCQLKNENSQLKLTIEQIQKQLNDNKQRFGGSIVKSSMKVQQLNQSVTQRMKFQQFNTSLDQVDNQQLLENQSNFQQDNQQATFLTQDSAQVALKNNKISQNNVCIQTEPTIEKIVMNISQIDNNEFGQFYQQELESFIHANQYRQMIMMEDRKMEQEKLYYNKLLKEKGLTRVSEQCIKLNVPTLASALKSMKVFSGQIKNSHQSDQLDVDQVCSDDEFLETLQQNGKKTAGKTKLRKLQKQSMIKKPNITNASVVQTSAGWQNQSVIQGDVRQINKTFDTQENLFQKHDVCFASMQEIEQVGQVDEQKTPEQKQEEIFSNDLLVDSLKVNEFQDKDSQQKQFNHQQNSQSENVICQISHETSVLNQHSDNRDLQHLLIKEQLNTKPDFDLISTYQTSINNSNQRENGALTKQQPSKVNKAEMILDQQVIDQQSCISQSNQSKHQKNQSTTMNEKQLYQQQAVQVNQNQDINYMSTCQEQKFSQESQKLSNENVNIAVQDVTIDNQLPIQLNVANRTKCVVDSSQQQLSQQSNNDIHDEILHVTQNLKQLVQENDHETQHQSDQQILFQSHQQNHDVDSCSENIQSELITKNMGKETTYLQATHENLDKLFEEDPEILEQELNIFKDKSKLQELLIASLQRQQQAQQLSEQQQNVYNLQQQEVPHDDVDKQLFDNIAHEQTQSLASCSLRQNMLVDNQSPNILYSVDSSSKLNVENEKQEKQSIQISSANLQFTQHLDSSKCLQQPQSSTQILQQSLQSGQSLVVVKNADQQQEQCKPSEQVSGGQKDVESKSYNSTDFDSNTLIKQIQAKDSNQNLLIENQSLQINSYSDTSLIDQQFVSYIHSKLYTLSTSQECIDVLFSQNMYPISLPAINEAMFQVLENVLYSESNINKMVDQFKYYNSNTKNILMHIYNSQFHSNLMKNQFSNADLLYLQHFLTNEQLLNTFARDSQKCSMYSKTNQFEPPLNTTLPTYNFNYFMFAEQLLKSLSQTSIDCLRQSFLHDIQSDDKSTQQNAHQLVDLLLDQDVMKKLLQCKFSQEANSKLQKVYYSNLFNQKLNQQQLQSVVNVFKDKEIQRQIFNYQGQDDKLQQYQVVQTNQNKMQEQTQWGNVVGNLFSLESAKQFLEGSIKFRQAVIRLFYSKLQSQKFMKFLQEKDQTDKSQSSSKIQVLLRNFIYNPYFSRKIQDDNSQLSVEEVKVFGAAIFQDEVFQLLEGQKYIDRNEFSAGQRLLSQCIQQKQYDDGISDLQVFGQSSYQPDNQQLLLTKQIAGEQAKISEVLPMTIKSISAERHQVSQVVSRMPPQYNGKPSLDGLDYDADLVISGNSLKLRASPAVYSPRPDAQLFDSLEQIENTDNYLRRTVPPPLPAVPHNAAVEELVHHHYDPKSRAKAFAKAQPCDLRVVGRPAHIGDHLAEKRAQSNRPAKREVQSQDNGVQLDLIAKKSEITPQQ